MQLSGSYTAVKGHTARALCSPSALLECHCVHLLECHCVHVCAVADEQLHDAQVAVPRRFMQGGEAFSAKEMGGEGWEQALPLSAGLKLQCCG
jgi:hypothetical protein